jgi:DNA invertase Pin-like site-specific DNA recombinase
MCIFGYIRVSTLQQANEGESLETQLRQIQSYAVLKGYEIKPENFITEKGVSGSLEFERRPEGAKLFEQLSSVDVLIFSKLDRAFRNTRNALNTLHELKLRGVSVHFIDLGGDVTPRL